jgi:L-methionine (R)-S-oxide reductase
MNNERANNTESKLGENKEEGEKFLQDTISEFDCVSGTLHRMEGNTLELVAYQGIPEPIIDRIREVPIGKGMAGLAAQEEEPVQICNLQTDDSGIAESRARDTGMEGSIAAPVFNSDGELRGTIGIAKSEAYEFSDAECEELLNTASEISGFLKNS